MSAIRFVVLCSLAVFFFTQVVLSRPDGTEEGSIKNVEAKVSVALEDMRKAMGDLFQNISTALQSEIQKHPEASQLYKNVTDSLTSVAQQIKDAVASATPKP
ncbi:hypothetical protein ONE63_010604 [Megalurothrips usitatus]|uniref:Secreted protein n=1 Tax=Megalurothrips usitatus TaxID=439358 RepID=A0AAV7XI11_9NEOP|nr:hypothetical protein ONE63_010604 [Megalurothrips usitatus]